MENKFEDMVAKSSDKSQMPNLLEKTDRLRVAWKTAEDKAKRYEQQIGKISEQLESMETRLRRYIAKQKDDQSEIVALLEGVVALHSDNDKQIRCFQPVEEVLESAASTAAKTTSNVCDIASTKAAANENEESCGPSPLINRSKERNKEIAETTTLTIDPIMKKPTQARLITRRSISADDLLGNQALFWTPTTALRSPFLPRTKSTLQMQMRTSTLKTGGSWTRGKAISNRPHSFQPLTKYFKVTSCDVCHGWINIAGKPAYKCEDCRQCTHVSCSSRLNLPCVPRRPIVPRTPSPHLYHLQEFCPTLPPMIAYPLIHCIVDLEKRGLSQEGLYRVPGRKEHVQSVLNEFRTSRGLPNLSIQEMEVVADVVKTFLKELWDPLVPKSSREEFIRAAQTNDIVSLNTAVCELPQPNRDTLSYLMLHLQKIQALKEVNKMSFENIARCMAIPIMGQVPNTRGDIELASIDTSEKEQSVLQMLKMSSEYWLQFLEHEVSGKVNASGSATPTAPVGKVV